MRISKTISILAVTSALFLITTVIAQDNLSAPEDTIDPLYVGSSSVIKGQPGMPTGLDEGDFSLESDGRVPSSVKPHAAVPAKTTQHWSASTDDGFQFKIRVKNQLSAVWVLKRADHFDVIFANNAGSRVNMTIPAQQFYALKNAATDLRSPASDLSKCRDQFIQLEMVETKTRKLVQGCLQAKGKEADQLRLFGSALTALVR